MPRQQLELAALLQLSDLLPQRRLGQPQFFCRPGKIAGFDNLHEIAQLVQINWPLLPSSENVRDTEP